MTSRNPHRHLLDDSFATLRARLEAWLAKRDAPRFRLQQALAHIFRNRAATFAGATALPRPWRVELDRSLTPPPLGVPQTRVSRDGTRKFAFPLRDGLTIESVWIPSAERGTLCVSSQAGCAAACSFCATGIGGLERNLTPAEILAQWISVGKELEGQGVGSVTQVVFMGMGEPLLNATHLGTALELLTSSEGFDFSPRRVTVSTVGIAPVIPRFVARFPQARLAVSLHSALDRTRDRIVPMNRRYPLGQLRRALLTAGGGSRRISFEYVLLREINDSRRAAEALAEYAADVAGHINLLPFHPFPGAPHRSTSSERLRQFASQVHAAGYPGEITIRRSRGLDIEGACGQLVLDRRVPPARS